MEEGRASKKRKITTDSAVVTRQVAQPWASQEEGSEAALPVSSPRGTPPREDRMLRHVDASTTVGTTRQQGLDKPSMSLPAKKGNTLTGKAANGKRVICGAGVAPDEVHPKSVTQTKAVQKRSKPRKGTIGKGAMIKPARRLTVQRQPPVDNKSGSTSSGEEEVD